MYTDGAWTPPDETNPYLSPAACGIVEFTICAPHSSPTPDSHPSNTDNLNTHIDIPVPIIYPLGQIQIIETTTTNNSTSTAHNTIPYNHPDLHTAPPIPRNLRQDSNEHGYISWVNAAQVNIDDESPNWIGAPTHTNNTGEMTAMHIAITRALTQKPNLGPTTIHSDSQYTINMTTGKWMPKKNHRNTTIIAALRALWRRILRARPGELKLKHVRSHTKLPGNDVADWLADIGTGLSGPTVIDIPTTERWLSQRAAQRSGKTRNEAGGGWR